MVFIVVCSLLSFLLCFRYFSQILSTLEYVVWLMESWLNFDFDTFMINLEQN